MFSLSPSANRRGFNLVEAAIVLGVVGLVIGGIWTAASSVARNQRQQEMYTALLQANQGVLDTATMMPMHAGDFAVDVTRVVFPNDVLVAGSTVPPALLTALYYPNTGTLFKQLSSGIYLTVQYEAFNTGGTRLFLMIGPMDQADCIWLASRLYKIELFPGTNELHYDISNTDGVSGAGASLLPTYGDSLETVQGNCAANSGNAVRIAAEYIAY